MCVALVFLHNKSVRADGKVHMIRLIDTYIVHSLVVLGFACFGVSFTVNAATMGEIILKAVLAIQGVQS